MPQHPLNTTDTGELKNNLGVCENDFYCSVIPLHPLGVYHAKSYTCTTEEFTWK